MPDPQPNWSRAIIDDQQTRWERTNTLGHQEAIVLHQDRPRFPCGAMVAAGGGWAWNC